MLTDLLMIYAFMYERASEQESVHIRERARGHFMISTYIYMGCWQVGSG